MPHKFRKPKPISEARRAAARANGAKSHGPVSDEGKAISAMNAISHGLTANALVLTTESKERYDALLVSYRNEYDPQGQTQKDLLEELTAAKWLHRRILAMMTGLIDVTMDRMDKEIKQEFETIDNGTRTALAFAKQTDQSGALALMHRYAARHARDYHRALDKLRQIQSEARGPSSPTPEDKIPTGHRSVATFPVLATSYESRATEEKMQNEPKPGETPVDFRPRSSHSRHATVH